MARGKNPSDGSRDVLPDAAIGREKILGVEAQKILDITEEQFRGVVRRGLLSSYHVPGCRPRFFREEVERLARQSMRPAAQVNTGAM